MSVKSVLIHLLKSTGDVEWLKSDDAGAALVKVNAAIPAGTNVVGKIRLVTATGDEITDDTLDAVKTIEQFSGAVYSNSDTAATDAARRFETTSKKLRSVLIQVTTNAQLFGDSSNQYISVAAGGSWGLSEVDISTLYFKNETAGQNGTVNIIGTEV